MPRISSHGDDITAPAIDHGAAVALATFGSPTPQLRLASENSEPVPRSRQSLPKQRVNHVASWKEPSSEGEEEKSSDAGRATHHLVASFSIVGACRRESLASIRRACPVSGRISDSCPDIGQKPDRGQLPASGAVSPRGSRRSSGSCRFNEDYACWITERHARRGRALARGAGLAVSARVPSFRHQVLVELFRNCGELAPELLRRCAGIELDHCRTEIGSADLSQIESPDYRADSVIVLHRENNAIRSAVIVEIQLGTDRTKRRSWPVYVTTVRARL
ncbi:MAG: hypothetical protein E6J91_37530, partial [Deltaproteobacteria bacterium]